MDWPDSVQKIFDGDLVMALAHVTRAHGVVVTPMVNFALHDRTASTITFLSSTGAWRKLERIRDNPQVAVAFHTRAHGGSDRPEYVLVQGTASFSMVPNREWLESIAPQWERAMGPRVLGQPWDWWLRIYHWERVAVTITIERVQIWPDLVCSGRPIRFGTSSPTEPAKPQRTPKNGTLPRINHIRAARRAMSVPESLLSWVDSDGFPIVVPVTITGANLEGFTVSACDGLIPPGGRRAGLTSHWFSSRVTGQRQYQHTGWLDVAPGRTPVYSPHTEYAYRLPPARWLYRIAVGAFTRSGLRRAEKDGFSSRWKR